MTKCQRYHCLIGIPGSGKSSLAQQWLTQSPQALYICPDQIRQECFGNASIQGSWAQIQVEISKKFAIATATGQDVLYDATNVKSEWRTSILHSHRPVSGQWIGWLLETPLPLCLERNQQRVRRVPVTVIQHYQILLNQVPPSLEEGFDLIFKLDGTAPRTELFKQVQNYLKQSLH